MDWQSRILASVQPVYKEENLGQVSIANKYMILMALVVVAV